MHRRTRAFTHASTARSSAHSLPDLCASASIVCVLPHTNDANPHTRRRWLAGARRARGSGKQPRGAGTAARARDCPPVQRTRLIRVSAISYAHARPLAHALSPSQHCLSRICVPPRQLCVLCHTQMTRTHTQGVGGWRVRRAHRAAGMRMRAAGTLGAAAERTSWRSCRRGAPHRRRRPWRPG